jgi:hypothetical protein
MSYVCLVFVVYVYLNLSKTCLCFAQQMTILREVFAGKQKNIVLCKHFCIKDSHVVTVIVAVILFLMYSRGFCVCVCQQNFPKKLILLYVMKV